MKRNTLNSKQVENFKKEGYLAGLPLFDTGEVKSLNSNFKELAKCLKPGEDHSEIREWHESSRWLYDICMDSRILDYVEGLLGPDFFCWASHFFTKAPHTPQSVPWHQDAHYWPLYPHNPVTVWIAFAETNEENGAMRIIPGTHKAGLIKHIDARENSSLRFELDSGTYREDQAVSLNLQPGSISIHDDALVHGSPPNLSDRWRIGFTIRYSGINVRADREIAPNFRIFMARGEDRFGYNLHGVKPTQTFARLDRSKQPGIKEQKKLALDAEG